MTDDPRPAAPNPLCDVNTGRSWTGQRAARWRLAGPVLAGAVALGWLLLRSGANPRRLAYPCQRAAFSTAFLAFGAPLFALAIALRRRLAAPLLSPASIALAGLAMAGSLAAWVSFSSADAPQAPALEPEPTYRAKVFHVTNAPQNPVGDRFPGLDNLIEMMGGGGLKFYESETVSLVAGPEGIVPANGVVLIKINYQWPERGGTNTDLLRGLIRRIVDHPDLFTGEIVVCENAQFQSTQNFDRAANNAQDTHQSPRDVVLYFQSLGHRVSLFDWTTVRYTSVGEYSAGDMADGYVIYSYDAQLAGRMSYPKFRTAYGTRISLKNGIWDAVAGYDRKRLRVINAPVLKSHASTYGATVCVKNYMGVVTRELSTNSHSAIANGILGAVMGEIRPPDLNLLDAIWINANPYSGPATSYAGATRRDMLVASKDPVAADIWAVKNILIPAFIANGYSPPWPTPSADPDNPNSAFRRYLDASMSRLIAAGFNVTNDLTRIDLVNVAPPGEASDPSGPGLPFRILKSPSGFELTWSAPIRGGLPTSYNLYRTALLGLRDRARPECEAALGSGTSATLPSLSDDCGFLVVGRNAVGDGSFGRDSRGRERPSPAPGSACP